MKFALVRFSIRPIMFAIVAVAAVLFTLGIYRKRDYCLKQAVLAAQMEKESMDSLPRHAALLANVERQKMPGAFEEE